LNKEARKSYKAPVVGVEYDLNGRRMDRPQTAKSSLYKAPSVSKVTKRLTSRNDRITTQLSERSRSKSRKRHEDMFGRLPEAFRKEEKTERKREETKKELK